MPPYISDLAQYRLSSCRFEWWLSVRLSAAYIEPWLFRPTTLSSALGFIMGSSRHRLTYKERYTALGCTPTGWNRDGAFCKQIKHQATVQHLCNAR